MNLLFIYNNAVNPTAGGVARITYTLGNLFRTNGHKVWFIAFKTDNAALDNLCQIYFPNSVLDTNENESFLVDFIDNNAIDLIINQSSIHKGLTSLLKRVRRRIAISIITCFHTSILTQAKNYAYQKEYWLKKNNRKYIFSLLRNRLIRDGLVKMYIIRWRRFYRLALSVCDYAVFLNEGQIAEMREMVGSSYNDKLQVISNCVPDKKIIANKKNNSLIWCGLFNIRIKRPDLMLLIWSKLYKDYPNWDLIMIGDGKDLNEMKYLARSLDLNNVIFTGRDSPDNYYSTSKIACITSTHETFSLVAIESMTNFMPVIAFNSFTMAKDLISNGHNGFLIDNFSVDDYVNKLKLLMSNDDLRSRMGKNAYSVSENYRPSKIYEQWNTLFYQINKI